MATQRRVSNTDNQDDNCDDTAAELNSSGGGTGRRLEEATGLLGPDGAICANCRVELDLLRPHVACRAESCNGTVLVCPPCFARGAEFGRHRNDHPYAVQHANRPLLSWDWSGADELRLLDALQTHGMGNWQSVADALGGGGGGGSRTAHECRAHYARYYTYRNWWKGLAWRQGERRPHNIDHDADNGDIGSEDNEERDRYLGRSRVAYISGGTSTTSGTSSTVHGLPRCELGSAEQLDEYAGYFAARGDFFAEPDPLAESMLEGLTFSDGVGSGSRGRGSGPGPGHPQMDPIDYEAQMALVDGYRRRVAARERTKEIVAQHGLLSRTQNAEWEMRYVRDLGETSVRRLLPMVSVVSPDDMLALMESLALAEQLKRRVCRLHDARSYGLRSQHEIALFERLHRSRRAGYTKPTLCREVLRSSKDPGVLRKLLMRQQRDSLMRLAGTSQLVRPGASGASLGAGAAARRINKSVPSPLAIEHLQGFFKLTTDEREFCSHLRLFPSTYLGLKSQLVVECQRNGGIRLSRARSLCSIDVNKTKRLYEFLLAQGLIHRPVS